MDGVTTPTPAEIAASDVRRIAEQLRDELINVGVGPLVYPMAFDVIATAPALAGMFARKINAHLLGDTPHG